MPLALSRPPSPAPPARSCPPAPPAPPAPTARPPLHAARPATAPTPGPVPARPAAVGAAAVDGYWQAAAACAGLPPAVVFARKPKDAAPALRACAVCPVRRQCVSAVAPAESLFDGVCGGRLWRNGRPAAVPSSSGSPRD
ncbi:WhiB family transcriptional regulator [Streptomyces subrutilus]|uniref:WhiB family transcriptional regulator n=1 Tax=Streptomyces subrutilus TaxID=36818 RepID=UPI002E10073E|nr:WhiB family transcriptional regulator [Streptomyces subrutilus]